MSAAVSAATASGASDAAASTACGVRVLPPQSADNDTVHTRVDLRHANGATATVYDHGAHVTAYRGACGRDVLFTSRRAVFARDKAIRGGVPVIFPQFGPGALPQHGFARASRWSIEEHGASADAAWVEFALVDSDATRAIFPHTFRLLYRVLLAADRLRTELRVENRGATPMRFTAALHSYFSVADIACARVDGTRGCEFRNQLTGERTRDDAAAVTFTAETDRVYYATPALLTVVDTSLPSRIVVEKNAALPDAVVWNPWVDKARKMADFDDEEYKTMVCVEAAAVAEPVELAPHQSWMGGQTLSLAANN